MVSVLFVILNQTTLLNNHFNSIVNKIRKNSLVLALVIILLSIMKKNLTGFIDTIDQ